jgi:hypothetical protein
MSGGTQGRESCGPSSFLVAEVVRLQLCRETAELSRVQLPCLFGRRINVRLCKSTSPAREHQEVPRARRHCSPLIARERRSIPRSLARLRVSATLHQTPASPGLDARKLDPLGSPHIACTTQSDDFARRGG